MAKFALTENHHPLQRYYVETYGCQMNEYDSLIAEKVLISKNYHRVNNPDEASLILLNTCSVRENAHQKIYNRLRSLSHLAKKGVKIGLLGCMAQSLGDELLQKDLPLDFILGPDALRDLGSVVEKAGTEQGAPRSSLQLSKTETYEDVIPSIDLHTGLSKETFSANVAIQRGCDKFCTFCVVPYTRGRERSRSPESIIEEINVLVAGGIKHVVLLGQNVNSYRKEQTTFTDLIKMILSETAIFRLSYSSPHPLDFPEELIRLTADQKRLGSWAHIPLQAGSDQILRDMRRDYTREQFLSLIKKFRDAVDDLSLSTDVIVGFPGETESQYEETLEVMELADFDFAYMFAYSERPHTAAYKKMPDDVAPEIKQKRLEKLIAQQSERSLRKNQRYIDRTCEVLVEGISKRSPLDYTGSMRNGKKVIIRNPAENGSLPVFGEAARVKIDSASSQTLAGKLV